LQTIPGFDQTTLQLVKPFMTAGSAGLDDFQETLPKMMVRGSNEILLRTTRFFPLKKGFEENEDGSIPYEGSPERIFARYKHSYYNRLSYGVTMEKDAGEALFQKSNPEGFDFYSAHFFLKNYRKWLKSIAIGDFAASMGQGLIMHSGFGGRKGAQVDRIARSQNGLRPYRSVDENNFLRGAGFELNFNDQLQIMAFGSHRTRDANLLVRDTLDPEVDQGVTSLQTSGLHRTAAEIADKGSVGQTSFGGRVGFSLSQLHLGANFLREELSSSLNRAEDPYNIFFFRGTELTNMSLDYRWSKKNYVLFGELARSDNGGVAFTTGYQISLARIADLSLLYRSFDKDYHALNSNAFSESSQVNNEKGFYTGLFVRPSYNWQFAFYYDTYRFDWLQFGVGSPAVGRDFRGRITWRKKRKFETYLEYRSETKQQNLRIVGENEAYLSNARREQIRWNFKYNLSKALVWRTRIDAGSFAIGPGEFEGFVLYQDFVYKPINFPLHFTSRLALFDTESYAIRFYSYENNLLNSFTIPPYYGKGLRYYLNLRYRGVRNFVFELRWAQTYRAGEDPYLGGNEGHPGNNRTEIGAQIKYSWGN
ncbi:MAG: helix-hairpin-helix domain-containing protein, partial [Saprospiraceae bacterium]|nr:helix-hairpin-helix domain-containing protein [Saprospiraceae bacterium]